MSGRVRVRCRGALVALAVLLVAAGPRSASAGCGAPEAAGTLVLVGDTLRYNHPSLWRRILDLAGGDLAELVILGAASERPRLYADFARRAFERHGAFVDVLPVAPDPGEFSRWYGEAVRDARLVEQVHAASAVFFVGGAPQRLARVLLAADGTPTPLARAVCDLYATGGVVVGGIPEALGADTGVDVAGALRRGSIEGADLHHGLGLMPAGWYVDQHFYSPGRFAETLVAMHHLRMPYGLGLGAGTMAVVRGGQIEVAGDEGVVFIDLSQARADAAGEEGFALRGVRLSLLDDGDRLNMHSLEAVAHPQKLLGFELPSHGGGTTPAGPPTEIGDVFARGRLLQLMIDAIDSDAGVASGLALGADGGGHRFSFRRVPHSRGWLSSSDGPARYTILDLELDVTPMAAGAVNAAR